MKPKHEIIIKKIEDINQFLAQGSTLRHCTIQNINFAQTAIIWDEVSFENTTFLGCNFASEEDEFTLRRKGAVIYPTIKNVPYKPYRSNLYTWQELEAIDKTSACNTDLCIYTHFFKTRHNPGINEALAQRIHDHAIDDALRDLLHIDIHGMPQKKCVGIMGGHGTLRTDDFYYKTALVTKMLAEVGYFVVSGGGPGIMEAANLGAYFAHKSTNDLQKAIAILCEAPYYTDKGYTDKAKEVLTLYPEGQESLAVPTWFYGHEPSNLFGTYIAKYFSNAIREDTLLAISLYGIVFSPGSAGTTQEIFMDAAQNHYGSYGYYSPMAFLGTKRYTEDTEIYSLLQHLSEGRKYQDLLYLSDEPEKIVAFIQAHPPILVKDELLLSNS